MTDSTVANPYSAPASQVETVNTKGGVVFCDAKKLTAGQGNRIIADAWKIYKTSPVKWTFITLVLFAMIVPLSLIPFIGSFLGSLIYTPLFAGLLIGASEVDKGGRLEFSHLFSAIKANAKGVFGFAIAVTVLSLINMVVAFAFMGGDYFMAMYGGQEIDPATLAIDPTQILMGTGVMVIAGVIFAMLYWFAIPLIALQSVGVFKAMGMSFKACLKNWLALTVYGLVMAFWLILGTLPVGLGLLIVLPLINITIYTSYRKIFTE